MAIKKRPKLIKCYGDDCNRKIKLFDTRGIDIDVIIKAIEKRGWGVNTNGYARVIMCRYWDCVCPTCIEKARLEDLEEEDD